MHSLNLGVYQIVVAEGILALARSSEKCLTDALKEAYAMFKAWLRESKVACSQRLWTLRSLHVDADNPNYPFLKCKAYNCRVIMGWLSESWCEASPCFSSEVALSSSAMRPRLVEEAPSNERQMNSLTIGAVTLF